MFWSVGAGAMVAAMLVALALPADLKEAARVQGAGGQIAKEKFSIGPYGFCAIAVDTEGNTFGLHSMK